MGFFSSASRKTTKLFLLCVITWAKSAEATKEISFEHANSEGTQTVTLVIADALASQAPMLIEKTRAALAIAEKAHGIPLRESFFLYFDSEPDRHNGFATVIPNNRIAVFSEAPELESSIGFSHDFILETIVHELGHMIPLQQRHGIFTGLSYIFGNSSRPLGLWPRWIHEGLAVWTESHTDPSHLSGRPASGIIDFDRRRFAEYVKRTGKFPFTDAHIDGSLEMPSRVGRGNLPYHFGYLLLSEWAQSQKDKESPFKNFVTEASYGLGVGFRAVFRTTGDALEPTFERAQKKWSETPLTGTRDLPEAQRRGQAPFIAGPFASPYGVTWIESDDIRNGRPADNPVLVTTNGGKRKDFRWPLEHSTPLEAHPLAEGKLLVRARVSPETKEDFFFDPARGAQSSLAVFSATGDFECWVTGVGGEEAKVRDISVAQSRIGWVEALPDGRFRAVSGKLEGCAVSRKEVITEGRTPFERLSSLHVTDTTHTLSRSQGLNSFRESIEGPGFRLRSTRSALSGLTPWPAACSNCYLAYEYGRDNWGPLLVRVSGKSASAQRLPLKTGSFRGTVGPDGKAYVKVGYFERDDLMEVTAKDFSENGPALEASEADSVPSGKSDAAPALEDYGAFPSVLPHFWVPNAAVTSGGYLITAETFFSDVTERWRGAVLAGYDSSNRSPFLYGSLVRSRLPWGPVNALSMSALYDPDLNLLTGEVQQRYSAGVAFQMDARPFEAWTLGFAPGATWYQGLSTPTLTGFARFVPTLSWSFVSSAGHTEHETAFRLPAAETGLALSQSARYMDGPEIVTKLNMHTLAGPFGLQSTFEHGYMDRANFIRYSYFEFGGLPTFATRTTGFLTRGFTDRILAGPEIARAAAQIGFNWGNLDTGFSFNRLGINYIDTRFLAEAVTTNLRIAEKLGDRFFPTVGVENDVFGSFAQYISYRLTLGYYYGFGKYGEHRFTLLLRSYLNL